MCLVAFSVAIFILGFLPATLEAAALNGLHATSADSIRNMCEMNQDELKNQNTLLQSLLNFAHDFDYKSEQLLDANMCTI